MAQGFADFVRHEVRPDRALRGDDLTELHTTDNFNDDHLMEGLRPGQNRPPGDFLG